MKKIIISVVAIALAIGVVSSSAYALFSDSVTVSGVTIKSGSAVLQVKNTPQGAFGDTATFNNTVLNTMMYPGFTSPTFGTFWLKNSSTANIGLSIKGKILDGATGDWDALKDVIQLRFTNVYASPQPGPTEWKTLNEWYQTGFALPQFLVPVGDDDEFVIEARMLDADNSVAGKTLSNITFEFTGTQIP